MIKINLCNFRPYDSGATTDPRVLSALIQYIQGNWRNTEIYIAESDATSTNADLLFKWLGFQDLASKLGVKTLNLSKDEKVKVKIKGRHFKSIRVSKTLLEADYFISLAKMKTHLLTKITCILKNQFGAIPYKRKIRFHPFLDDAIVDANIAMKPDFSIVDGIISMQTEKGPTYGMPIKTNLLIAGKDPVAVDATCARVMGFNPYFIGSIRKASRAGLGSMRPIIVGENIQLVRTKFKFNLIHSWMLRFVYWMRAR